MGLQSLLALDRAMTNGSDCESREGYLTVTFCGVALILALYFGAQEIVDVSASAH